MSWSLVRVVLLCSLAVVGSSCRSVPDELPTNQDHFTQDDASVGDGGNELDEAQIDSNDATEDVQNRSVLPSLPSTSEEEKVEVLTSEEGDGEPTEDVSVEAPEERELRSSCSSLKFDPLPSRSRGSKDVPNSIGGAEQRIAPPPLTANPKCMTIPYRNTANIQRSRKYSEQKNSANPVDLFSSSNTSDTASTNWSTSVYKFGLKSTDLVNSDTDPHWSCSPSGQPRSSNNITHSQGCCSSFDRISEITLPGNEHFIDPNTTMITTPENCVFCNKSMVMLCSGSQVKQVPAFMGRPTDLQYLVFDKTDILELDKLSIHLFPFTDTLALLNGRLFRVEFAPLLSRVLKEIVIVNNSLTGLDFSWFFDSDPSFISTVTSLNLMDNLISYLSDPNTGSELVLPSLQTVILSNNPLKVLPVHVFRPLRASPVKCLSLRSCCLKDYGSEGAIKSPLQYLSQLQTLDLSENSLLSPQMLAGLLEPLTTANLSTLRLSGNSYLSIPWTALQHVGHSLVELDLHSSSLSCLDMTSFPDMPRLETLHLDFSRITSILPGTFCALPSLRSLTLEGNGLMSVPSAVRLPSLTYLSLSNNPRTEDSQGKCIFTINVNSFTGMTSLLTLNMAEIPLVSLRNSQFSGLPSLTELSLNNTSLELIEPGSFRGLRKLRKLFLNENMLTILKNGTFEGLENLSLLDLSNNRVTFSSSLVIPVRYNTTSLFAKETPAVEEIQKKRSNRAVCLSNDVPGDEIKHESLLHTNTNEDFTLTPNTTANNISKSSVEVEADKRDIGEAKIIIIKESDSVDDSQNLKVNDWPFTDLKTLEILNLNENRITGMIPIFDELQNLTALDLGNNKILEWGERLFTGCSNLKVVNLNDNQIRTLTDAMVQDFSSTSLDKINLMSNHLECSCDLSPFVEDLNDEHFVNFELYECSTGKSIVQLTAYLSQLTISSCKAVDETSEGTLNVSTMVLAIGLCVVLVVSSMLYMHHRSRRKPVLLVSTGESSSDLELETQFEYDVFVCYAAPEKTWVFAVLLPVFEKELNLDVCVHERDFQVGDLITVNIENSINKSRKVLFVLSRAFLASTWCCYELTTAQTLAYDRSKLLVLQKETIPKEEQSSTLQHLLQTRTFIPWSEDSEEQTLVWEKFRKVLVPKDGAPAKKKKKGGVTILRQFLRFGPASILSQSAKKSSDVVPIHKSFRMLNLAEDAPQKEVHAVGMAGKDNLSFEGSSIPKF